LGACRRQRLAAAAIYTQRNQDRLQRVARETTKREEVYANFIMSASTLLLNAYLHDGFTLDAMDSTRRACKSDEALCSGERYQRSGSSDERLIEISLKPSLDLRKLAAEQLSKTSGSDLLQLSARLPTDLDQLHRTVH